MEKTIVIDGVEYILTPKNPPAESTPPVVPERSILDEYVLPQEVTEEVPVEEDISPVKIVSNVNGIQTAIPKSSEYRERFQNKQITTKDVSVRSSTHVEDLRRFTDIPEIREADSGNKIPTGLGGFYGPGVERDYF